MPSPELRMCVHSPPEIILSSHIMKNFGANLELNYNGTSRVLDYSMGLIDTLTKLHRELSQSSTHTEVRNNTEHLHLTAAKDDILSTHLYAQLMGERIIEDSFRTDTPCTLRRLIFSCKRNNVDCPQTSGYYDSLGLSLDSASLKSCIWTNIFQKDAMHIATSQGISKGITLILRTGYSFLWKALNLTSPGMLDYGLPNRGMSGVRLIIGEMVNKDGKIFKVDHTIEGIDIPQGFAATIGIKAKKTIHLPHPYTDCKMQDDPEMAKLAARDDIPGQFSRGMVILNDLFAYNPMHCR